MSLTMRAVGYVLGEIWRGDNRKHSAGSSLKPRFTWYIIMIFVARAAERQQIHVNTASVAEEMWTTGLRLW